MSDAPIELRSKPRVAIGPEMPGWGSWDWLGADLQAALARYFETSSFAQTSIPSADVVLLVKHSPDQDWLEAACRRSLVIYSVVDYYTNAAHIASDAAKLRMYARVVVHSDSLRPYFAPYARVEVMDHHIRFAAPIRSRFRKSGPILWVGVRSNLEPLLAWITAHPLPEELLILTNFESPDDPPPLQNLGLPQHIPLRLENWSRERHLEFTASARAAIDIKGSDFRAQHKPPAKAMDFLASGVPLAMNPGSRPMEHLLKMGFELASPLEPQRWLSYEYWQETVRFGRAIRELLSLERVALRWKCLIDHLLAERRFDLRSV